MSRIETLTQDYNRVPVPDGKTVNAWHIALIKIGIVIALPAFFTGAEIGAAMGLADACLVVIVAAFLLALLAALTGTVGASSRLSTSMILQFSFGRLGAKIVNLILGLTLLGWFGVTTALFGHTLNDLVIRTLNIRSLPTIYMFLGGLLMIATTVFGFKALQKLSDLVVPLLLAGIIVVAYMSTQQSEFHSVMLIPGDGSLSIGLGISALVGGMVVGVTIFPDLARFAHSPVHGRGAAVLSYGLGVPFVLIAVAIPSIITGEKDLLLIMLSLGLGITALMLLIITAWTTNAGNLYSSSLVLGTIFQRVQKWKICIMAGLIGTVFAASGITDYFLPFLLLLGVCIPPIAGIYLADFFFIRNKQYDLFKLQKMPAIRINAFVAWLLGISVASMTSRDIIFLTSIPSCDAVLTAFSAYILIEKVFFGNPVRQCRK